MIRRFLFALTLLVPSLALGAYANPTYDSIAAANSGTGTNVTVNFTPDGHGTSGRYVVACVAFDNVTATVSGANAQGIGQNYTLLAGPIRSDSTNDVTIYMFGLSAPAITNQNFQATISSSSTWRAGIMAFYGVAWPVATGTAQTNTGTTSSPTVNVASQTDEMVADCVGMATSSTPSMSVGAGQAQRVNNESTTLVNAMSTEAGAGSVTMSWSSSGSSPSWATAAVNLKIQPSDYANAVLSSSPTHYFHLGEASGGVVDHGRLGYPGGTLGPVYTNSPTLNQPGIPLYGATDGSVQLDGTNDYVAVDNSSDFFYSSNLNDSFSIEGWVKLISTTGALNFLIVNDNTGADSGLFLHARADTAPDNYLAFKVGNTVGGGYAQANYQGTVQFGQWYHFVGTTLGAGSGAMTRVRLHVNGVQQQSITSFTGTLFTSVNITYFGRRSASPEAWCKCYLDEIAYYKANSAGAEMSEATALAHYNAGITSGLLNQRRIFQSKKPELPRFMDDGYMAKFMAAGFNTGLVHHRRWPQRLELAWLPFTVAPDGRGN